MLNIDVRKTVTTAAGKETLRYECAFRPGEAVAVVGPSGAGKTTLLRIIAGLIRPDGGRIECGGRVWYDSGRRIDLSPGRRGIGYVSQEESLFTHMSVADNIRYGCREPEYAEFLIRISGLNSLKSSYPGGLSGGQKQRVALCRALSHRPGILLLDEPFSALDRTSRQALQSQVVRLRRTIGFTLLFVSHDEQEIGRLAGREYAVGRACPWERPGTLRTAAGG